jgi:uncharacterized membrane-anchored protein YhcB (DUF1043 family)
MLNKEMLKANDQLKDLTPEQLAAIIILSENDENQVIAKKTKAFWDNIDADVLAATGEAKPATTKSYDHLKTVLAEAKKGKGSLDTLKAQLADKETAIADLQKKLKDGAGDEAVKAQLADLQKKYTDEQARAKNLEDQLATEKNKYEDQLAGKDKDYLEVIVGGFMDAAVTGATYKDGYDKEVVQVVLANAKAKVLGMGTPELTEVDGVRTAIIRNEDGLPIPNPNNLQKPFTIQELYLQEIQPVLKGSAKKTGTGGTPGAGGNPSTLDLSGVKTQVEATQRIQEYLKAQDGLKAGTAAFEKEEVKLWKENNVGDLPTK